MPSSLYMRESLVAGFSFRKSYAVIDEWAVEAFQELGVPASYREINDIISPRGKIAGAAQARRRGFVLHHTTIAHSMDVGIMPRVIRIGRPSLAGRGVRSAEKLVSPLALFTRLGCSEIASRLRSHFKAGFQAAETSLSAADLGAAGAQVASKYG